MKLELRCDKNNRLGFVEKYSPYFYDDRRISVLSMCDVGGYFSEPYIYRGDEFIPASQIDEEMGIAKYIKAKKPFYSVIGTGNIILDAKISMSLGTPSVYIPEKSLYSLYYLDKDSLKRTGERSWEVQCKRLSSMNITIEGWLQTIGERFVKYEGNRESFLKSRF